MSSLKNPFGEKKRKTYTDFRYLPEGKWKKMWLHLPTLQRRFSGKKQWDDSTTTFCASWKAVQ